MILRLPKVDANSTEGQVVQINGYLRQLVMDLQMELDRMGSQMEAFREALQKMEETKGG